MSRPGGGQLQGFSTNDWVKNEYNSSSENKTCYEAKPFEEFCSEHKNIKFPWWKKEKDQLSGYYDIRENADSRASWVLGLIHHDKAPIMNN